MSEYVFSLSDISVSDGSAVVQINNSDSVFGVIEGSQFFVAGKIPVGVIESDTVNRTLTLTAAWDQGDIANAAAKVIPLGAVATLLTALERNRAAYQAFVDAGGGGSSSIEWGDIVAATLPDFVKRWGKYSEITDKPDYAQGWPSFENVTGTVSKEQLPDSIETDSKRTQALSPPVRTELSILHRLVDYPKMKPVESMPTHSPNNKREILFDSVRQAVYFSFEDKYKAMPTTLESRKFAVFYRGLYLRLNSAFTGSLTLKVFPMGNGGLGLPNNPTLTNNEWHTVTMEITSALYKIGEFGGEYFEGIIDFVKLENGWETLHTDKSHYRSLDAYFDGDGVTLRSPFENFHLRDDGYWYSEDMLPETPHSIGASWSQDSEDFRTYTVTGASENSDGLRFFGDTFDEFEFELIVISDVNRKVALTGSNSAPNIISYPGVERFITNERIFIKRNNGTTPITGTLTFESLRMRLPKND